MRLFSNAPQMTSKCCKNKKKNAPCATNFLVFVQNEANSLVAKDSKHCDWSKLDSKENSQRKQNFKTHRVKLAVMMSITTTAKQNVSTIWAIIQLLLTEQEVCMDVSILIEVASIDRTQWSRFPHTDRVSSVHKII